MPTFNQLVRKGRQTSVKKSTAPALQKSFNSLKKKSSDMSFTAEERCMYSRKDCHTEKAELCS